MYRYIGNKTAILPELLGVIANSLPSGASCLDAMSGTGAVSEGLAKLGHRVTANDILTFPSLHSEVRLRMNKAPRFSKLGMPYGKALGFLNGLKPIKGYYWNEYSPAGKPKDSTKPRKYLSPANASKLDAIDLQLKAWQREKLLTSGETKLIRHDVIMAVNKVANISGTYGHYRSTFAKSAERPIELIESQFNSWASKKNQVTTAPAEKISGLQYFDMIYMDPPYMKRQYAANYHLLETLALGDNPPPIGESGLRNWWPQYSDFCSKRKIRPAFEAVLGKKNFGKAFVSYSEDGLLSKDEMRDLLKTFGDVLIHVIEHKRFRSNKSDLDKILDEYVFEVTPK